jgi:hypothetical protein
MNIMQMMTIPPYQPSLYLQEEQFTERSDQDGQKLSAVIHRRHEVGMGAADE